MFHKNNLEFPDMYELVDRSFLLDREAINLISAYRELEERESNIKEKIKFDGTGSQDMGQILSIKDNKAKLKISLMKLNYEKWNISIFEDNQDSLNIENQINSINIISKVSSVFKNRVLQDLYILGDLGIVLHRTSNFLRPNFTIYEGSKPVGIAEIRGEVASMFIKLRYGDREYEFQQPILAKPAYVISNGQPIGYIQHPMSGGPILGNLNLPYEKEFITGFAILNVLRKDWIRGDGMPNII